MKQNIFFLISYLGDNASVDSISSKLREVCPNLYKNEDAACSKANEMLLCAKKSIHVDERETKLRAALDVSLFLKLFASGSEKLATSQKYRRLTFL